MLKSELIFWEDVYARGWNEVVSKRTMCLCVRERERERGRESSSVCVCVVYLCVLLALSCPGALYIYIMNVYICHVYNVILCVNIQYVYCVYAFIIYIYTDILCIYLWCCRRAAGATTA